MVIKRARRRWIEAQPEYIVAHGKVRAMKQARVRYPDPSLYDGDLPELYAASLDAENSAMAELDAAKAELREVRRRLEKQFDDAELGRTGGSTDPSSHRLRWYAVRIAQGLWTAAAIFVLGISLWVYTPTNDAPLLLAYGMFVLSFPSGLVLTLAMMFVYMGVAGLFGFGETGYVTVVVQWWTMAVAGYWQWFKFVPWIWRKLRPENPQASDPGREHLDVHQPIVDARTEPRHDGT